MKLVRPAHRLRIAAVLVTAIGALSLAFAPAASASTKYGRCSATASWGTWTGQVRAVYYNPTGTAVKLDSLGYSAWNDPSTASEYLVIMRDNGGARTLWTQPRTLRGDNTYTFPRVTKTNVNRPYLKVYVYQARGRSSCYFYIRLY